MLLSMTGFGDARRQDDRLQVSAEIRSVNNRHLKITVRCPEAALGVENEVERLVRQSVGRGTVNVNLRIVRLDSGGTSRINRDRLIGYWNEFNQVARDLHLPAPTDMGAFLELPGVISESNEPLVDSEHWPLVEAVVRDCLSQLGSFRQREGRAMRDEMAGLLAALQARTAVVSERASQVVVEYRDKLKQRVTELLRESEVIVGDADLIREVSLFADRCDVTEELARLRSHIEQFQRLLDATPSSGRQLEFLCQELVRELNTIGSKANDIAIAHAVVEGKAAVEKIREIVQNVE
ncbi:MAG: YicC family protein [Planctomyces sp.]|nr:YicC family protein [Planctomyces sp.]